jgi:DNA repair protein RadC
MTRKPCTYTVSTIRHRRRRNPPPSVRTPEEVLRLVRPLVRDADREHFYCLHLSARNTVLEVALVSVGTVNASLVHPREVFKRAIALSAASIIVVHNHPSGDPAPSTDDLDITSRLTKAGELLGIEVLDHVIVCNGHFTSFREEKLLRSAPLPPASTLAAFFCPRPTLG